MANPAAKWQALVSGKCPSLARSRQVEGQSTGEDEHSGNGVEGHNTASRYSLAKYPHVRVTSGIFECSRHVGDHEHVADQEDHAEYTVHEVCTNHGTRDRFAGVFDLFGHVGCRIGAYSVC